MFFYISHAIKTVAGLFSGSLLLTVIYEADDKQKKSEMTFTLLHIFVIIFVLRRAFARSFLCFKGTEYFRVSYF